MMEDTCVLPDEAGLTPDNFEKDTTSGLWEATTFSGTPYSKTAADPAQSATNGLNGVRLRATVTGVNTRILAVVKIFED